MKLRVRSSGRRVCWVHQWEAATQHRVRDGTPVLCVRQDQQEAACRRAHFQRLPLPGKSVCKLLSLTFNVLYKIFLH